MWRLLCFDGELYFKQVFFVLLFQCQWYCAESEAERQQYCADRNLQIEETRRLVIKTLKSLLKDRMGAKRGLFESNTLFRKSLSQVVRKTLSEEFLKKALANDENEELVFMSEMLEDNTVNWDN